MKKKKVLVLGIGQSNYILQLYGKIKNRLPDFSFSISGLRPLFNIEEKERANEIFENIIDLKNKKWSIFQLSYAFFNVIVRKYIYKELAALWLDGTISIKVIAHAIVRENMKPFLVAQWLNKSDFDILHIHFIKSHYVSALKYVKKKFTIINTFWGSDLMRTSGHKEGYYQTMALERGDIITCATHDMANIVMSKYGRHLVTKIRYAKFIHDPKIYELIDYYRGIEDWRPEFRKKYEIKVDNKIVIIGHNAARDNNHKYIIESFEVMSENEQTKFTCIFPLTYAAKNREYISEVKQLQNKYKMQFIFLEEYISWNELAQLKLIADVMIHMPTSDGLSAALTEFFYANGIVVTGSWLPYSTFSQANLYYYSYENFTDLKNFWAKDYKKNTGLQDQLNLNVEIVKNIFSIEKIANSWENIFNNIRK